MNKTETIQVITLLAGNYDSIAKKDSTQKQLMVNTWLECLGDLDYNLVLQAVKKTIIESPYPPTIHDIRKNAVEMINPSTQRTSIEAWNEAYKMICNGLYMTEEQFEQHSPEVKKFFGNVRQVKEQAQVSTDVVNSVTKGQFLKQYEVIVNREKEQKLLPQSMQEIINKLTENANIKQIGE
nr:MAG TPA_asm: replisome organizer [Bacteriophage sp.]